MPDAAENSSSATSEPSAPQDSLSIANELISARTERGFSQVHLAELSGVSRSAIKAYESGRNMPGSRELRALCLALKVTPNKLLFGSESPVLEEGDAARIDALLRTDLEGRAVLRMRLALVSELLTAEEAASLLLLALSIATARHGPEKVKKNTVTADLLAGMTRGMVQASAEAARTGAIDVEKTTAELKNFMIRQGNEEKPAS